MYANVNNNKYGVAILTLKKWTSGQGILSGIKKDITQK